jgi:hypothetical protein
MALKIAVSTKATKKDGIAETTNVAIILGREKSSPVNRR